MQVHLKLGIYSVSPTPTQLSEHKYFMTPGARAIFLHSNVLYNNIKFVTGGHKNTGGGGGGGAKQNKSETWLPGPILPPPPKYYAFQPKFVAYNLSIKKFCVLDHFWCYRLQ